MKGLINKLIKEHIKRIFDVMKTLLEISIQNIEKEMPDTQKRWTAYVASKPLVDSTQSFNNRNNITQVKICIYITRSIL